MEDKFVDFYEVMQISPNAEPETVQRVFRMLAGKLHPDNAQTGDLEAFVQLNQAYEMLSNPATRAVYDAQRADRQSEPMKIFDTREFAIGLDGEANRRLGILCLLYGRRRADSDNPGVSVLELESLMGTPREHLLFATWYLREKEYVRLDDRSSLLITAEGLDHVEQNLKSNQVVYRLLKEGTNAQAKPEGADDELNVKSEAAG